MDIRKYIAHVIPRTLVPTIALALLLTSCGDFFEFDQDAIEAGEMTLERTTIDLMVGDRYEIPFTITPEELSNSEVYWYTDNAGVVKFEDNVLVAVGEGTATVTAITVSEQLKATCQVVVHQPWSLADFRLPYDMVIYANVTVDGRPMDANMRVGAFINDKLHGVGEIKSHNGQQYMAIRVFSQVEGGEEVVLRCYDALTCRMLQYPEVLTFDGWETLGTLSSLYELNFE